jgi:hypothetical protein
MMDYYIFDFLFLIILIHSIDVVLSLLALVTGKYLVLGALGKFLG